MKDTDKIKTVNRFYFGKNTGNISEFYLGLKGVVSIILEKVIYEHRYEQLYQNFLPSKIENFKAIVSREQTIFIDEENNIIIKEEGTTI
ncbi:MAG: hypothetical protein IJX26_02265 [Clostridia bacterium]|nr:hypothetical protein [Clostridia bacterium]